MPWAAINITEVIAVLKMKFCEKLRNARDIVVLREASSYNANDLSY